MQHLIVAEKSLLVGDEFARLLVRYSALVARTRGGESVTFAAISSAGEHVEVTVLVDLGMSLIAESADSQLPEPDNHAVERALAARLAEFDEYPTAPSEADPAG